MPSCPLFRSIVALHAHVMLIGDHGLKQQAASAYNDRVPAKPTEKLLSAAQRSARARKAARARWGPPKHRKKNAAASALAKLRWASVSEEDVRAIIAKMVAARKRRKKSAR